MRLNSSRAGVLGFIGLLAFTTQMFSQTPQSGIEKPKSLPRSSIRVKARRNLADDEDGIRRLFTMGNEAVLSLIKFLSDRDEEKRIGAARGLAYIGSQLGMQALRNAVKAETDEETKSGMSCFLAGGLVETKSQSDLDFLRITVERAHFAGEDDEKDCQGFCAALALGMRGGDDSLAILRKISKDYLIDSVEVRRAVQWMESKSTPRQTPSEKSLSDEEVIKKIVLDGTFFAEDEQSKTSIEEITFSKARNRALVFLEIYNGPKDARGYDLVLAKQNGRWRVVGIWFAWVA
jgi:hypothetical protein